MTEKQAILRDLKVIAILDKKIDYSDHDNVGAVLKLNPKSLFSTEYGQRYLDRIRLMYDGREYEHTCILCGSPLKDENPVCENCYKMITLGNAVVPKKPEQIVSEQTEGSAADGKSDINAEVKPEASDVKEQEPAVEKKSEPVAQEKPEEEAPKQQKTETLSAEESAQEKAPEAALTETATAASDKKTNADAEKVAVASDDESTAKASAEDHEVVETSVDSREANEASAIKSEDGAVSEAKSGAESESPKTDNASTAESPDDDEENDDKASDDLDQNRDSDNSNGRIKYLEIGRACILLFVVMCFSISIVCGIVIAIRNLRIKNQETGVREQVIKDADLRDYYNTIYTRTGYTISVEDDS